MHRQGLEAVEALVTRKREPYETIHVSPLSPVIGAEIMGVDLSGRLSNSQFDEIHRAFLEHHVLVFRDQNLTDDDHKSFSRRFGKLHVHPLNAVNGTSDPEVLVVRSQ